MNLVRSKRDIKTSRLEVYCSDVILWSEIPWRSLLIWSIVISIIDWAAEFISILSIAVFFVTSVTRVPVAHAHVPSRRMSAVAYQYVETHLSRTEYGSIKWTMFALQAAHIHSLRREFTDNHLVGFRFLPELIFQWSELLFWLAICDWWLTFGHVPISTRGYAFSKAVDKRFHFRSILNWDTNSLEELRGKLIRIWRLLSEDLHLTSTHDLYFAYDL